MGSRSASKYEVRQPTDGVTGAYETVALFEWEEDARNYVVAVNKGTVPYENEFFEDFSLIAASLWTGEVIAW